MNWQLFPLFLIKAIFGAAVCVGLVGSLLAGFFLGVDYLGSKYGFAWGFFTVIVGIAFVICSIGFFFHFMDEYAAKQKVQS